MCGQAFTNQQGNVRVIISTKGKGMCKETPAQGTGLVNTSPQGQLWGLIGNCAAVLAQWKVFFRTNTSWCEGTGIYEGKSTS